MSGTPPARPKTRRAVVLLFVLLLLAATLVLLELASAFFAPSWPQRALRTRPFLQPGETGGEPVLAYWPQFGVPVNSWGMRDLPRHREKAPGGYRVLFVGDSFLEGGFTVAPLPLRVEQMLFVSGSGREEVVNLGVSGTGPPSYLYRIERVGFALQPDAVFVLFFAGNDFVSPDEAHDGWRVPPLIAEPPLPSVLGTVAPRLTWLLVARLGLAEAARGQPQVPEELTTLARIMQLPPDQAADRLAEHAQRHYFPAMDMDALRAIFARGDETFWRSFVPRELDPELLQGWIVKGLVEWETSTWEVATSLEEARAQVVPKEIDATLSWLRAIRDAVRERGLAFRLFLAPTGNVDPEFVTFWRPWPRYASWNLLSDARQERLMEALRGEGIEFVDLGDTLRGISGTYRKTDGHWNERGHTRVAERVRQELRAVASPPSSP